MRRQTKSLGVLNESAAYRSGTSLETSYGLVSAIQRLAGETLSGESSSAGDCFPLGASKCSRRRPSPPDGRGIRLPFESAPVRVRSWQVSLLCRFRISGLYCGKLPDLDRFAGCRRFIAGKRYGQGL